MKKVMIRSALCSMAVGAAFSTSAINITYDTFGSTSDTFGGSGIPNNAVATTVIQNGAATINLGLTAHQRYDNPALINNGAGTFTATAGSNAKPDGTGTVGALWNFAWDIDVLGASASSYKFTLLYDFNPGVGTADSAHGSINLSNPFASQDGSENLLFSYLNDSTINGMLAESVGLVVAPNGSFDPNANGEYTFALIAANSSGTELGRSAIRVNVVGGTSAAVPDGGATSILLGLGVAGMFAFRKLRE
jgi:hypothetical protein